MGSITRFSSEHKEKLQREFLEIARRIEVGEIAADHYNSEELRRFHALAKIPAVNPEPYDNEAILCLLRLEGSDCYAVFDKLLHFAIRAKYAYSDQQTV